MGRPARRAGRLTTMLGRVRPFFLTIALVTGAIGPSAAQAPVTAPVSAPRAAAEKAWRAGQWDELEKIGQANPADEGVIVLRAKAAAARGDYSRAEALLQ